MKRHIEELRRLDGNKITNSYLKQPVSLSKHLIKLQSLLVTSMITRQLNKYSYSKLYLEDCLFEVRLRVIVTTTVLILVVTLSLSCHTPIAPHTYIMARRCVPWIIHTGFNSEVFCLAKRTILMLFSLFALFFLALLFFSLSPCLLFVFGCTGTRA